MKWLIAIMFVLIIASLAGAGVFLVRDRGRTRNVARALTWRIALSVTLFVVILFANWMGWIQSQ
jgi:hypothetical protein